MIPRRLLTRRLLTLGAASAVAGCGFRPLYLPEGGRGSPASEALAAIYVPVMAERSGQLLRQALQRRIEGAGTGVAKKYDLIAVFSIAPEGVGIQRDSSTTRIRLVGTVTWALRELNLAHTVLTSGNARVLDGYNILNQQYFAADMESDAAAKRVAESLADQVVTQLAIFLKNRAAPAPA